MNSRFNSSKYSGNHSSSMDIESLEKRNDASISSLGEKSALLKQVSLNFVYFIFITLFYTT